MKKRLLLAVVMTALLSSEPLLAQQGYSSWSDPRSPQSQASQPLIDEIRVLIEAAEKAKAADPKFIRDLKEAIARHENPRTRLLLADDFTDGDITANPAWQVESGRWWVEKGYGLRSASETAAESAPAERDAGRDVAKKLLGAVLQQALDPEGRSRQPTTVQAGGVPATIRLPGFVGSSFALKADFSSWQGEGAVEIGVYQGTAAGYRLVYRPGSEPALELQRATSSGTGVIDRTRLAAGLEDRKTHALEFTRSQNGDMRVSLDGKLLLQANDRSFRDPFDGVIISTRGGDFMVARVQVMGE